MLIGADPVADFPDTGLARRALELLPGFGAAETEAGGESPVSLARQSSPLSRTTS